MFVVGAVQVSVAVPEVTGWVTLIENGARDALLVPSLTEMTMLEYVPTFAVVGVPETVPLAMLKVAQDGRFCTLKESAAPAASLAVGVKLYGYPATSVVDGVPEIVGGGGGGGVLTGGAETVMEKGASDARATPSLTLITMFGKLPTFVPAGVPESRPVAGLKLAQEGLPEIEKVRVWPLGPLAVGVKL